MGASLLLRWVMSPAFRGAPSDLWLRGLPRRLEPQGAGAADAPQGAGSGASGAPARRAGGKAGPGPSPRREAGRARSGCAEPRRLHARERKPKRRSASVRRNETRLRTPGAARGRRCATRIKQGASRWLDRWRPGRQSNVMERRRLSHLVARLTGRWHLQRLVGARGEDRQVRPCAARGAGRAAARLSTGWRRCCQRRASAASVHELQRRMEDLQRSFAHQDRAFAEAFERARLLDEQGMDDRRFARRIERASAPRPSDHRRAHGPARSDSSCCTGSPSSDGW